MIARPARVRMRNRNPWVLARRRLFGWNVRLPLLTAVVLPVLGYSSYFGCSKLLRRRSHPVTRARTRKNTRRWAGDDQSLGGRCRCRQNKPLASPSGRHAVTSVVLAYTGFLWQHPRLVNLRRLDVARCSWPSRHVGDPGSRANTVIHSCGQPCGRTVLVDTALQTSTGRRGGSGCQSGRPISARCGTRSFVSSPAGPSRRSSARGCE